MLTGAGGGGGVCALGRCDGDSARDEADAKAETTAMETNMTAGDVAEIPEGEEGGAPDMSLVQRRVHELVRVLSKFKELRDPSMSRQDYVDRLKRDLATYYGYNDYFLDLVRRESKRRRFSPSVHQPISPTTALQRRELSRMQCWDSTSKAVP